jgi:hypothetical protein
MVTFNLYLMEEISMGSVEEAPAGPQMPAA